MRDSHLRCDDAAEKNVNFQNERAVFDALSFENTFPPGTPRRIRTRHDAEVFDAGYNDGIAYAFARAI